jgi:hypothetical protein
VMRFVEKKGTARVCFDTHLAAGKREREGVIVSPWLHCHLVGRRDRDREASAWFSRTVT